MNLLLILAFLLVPCLAHALPTPDDVRVSEVASTDVITDFLDIGAGCANPVLVVHVNTYSEDVAVSSVVADAGALTQLPGARVGYDVGGGNWWYQDTWYRTGVAMTGTTQNATATLAAAASSIIMVLRGLCGVDQTTPFGTAVAEADDSVDVSSVSGDLVIDNSWTYGSSATATPATGQTERYNYWTGAAARLAGGERVGGGTITMAWTVTAQTSTMGVAVKSPAAATVTRRQAVVVQ